MPTRAILLPMVALAALTMVVWLVMYRRRLAEMRRAGIQPQALATRAAAAGRLADVTAADNFRNLLETPVLFYAVCLALVAVDGVTPVQVVLAWSYVALRVVHSAIHCTYNRVVHRFVAYVLGTLCLWAMWALLGVALIGGGAA